MNQVKLHYSVTVILKTQIRSGKVYLETRVKTYLCFLQTCSTTKSKDVYFDKEQNQANMAQTVNSITMIKACFIKSFIKISFRHLYLIHTFQWCNLHVELIKYTQGSSFG